MDDELTALWETCDWIMTAIGSARGGHAERAAWQVTDARVAAADAFPPGSPEAGAMGTVLAAVDLMLTGRVP